MNECFFDKKEEGGCGCEHGFMGFTHALSAVAVFSALTAFFPKHVYDALGTTSLLIVILAAINLTGACLSVDLDNTKSTSRSSLGLLGEVLSNIYRAISTTVQTLVRTGRDDSEPNPHRGFFHTLPAALILGFLTYKAAQYNGLPTDLPLIGKVTGGYLFALVISWMNLHMAIAGLFKQLIYKVKKKGGAFGAGLFKQLIYKVKKKGGAFGEAIAFAISLSIVYSLFMNLPTDLNFWWLGVSVAFGMYVHSFADAFTTYGSPIIFPIPRKGKLWYNVRFLGIKSGGVVEQFIFVPFFAVVILISFVKISAG